jgi:hypothetical protein
MYHVSRVCEGARKGEADLVIQFAKLEMAMTTAFWVANFDYKLCDKDGNLTRSPPNPIDRNKHSASKPEPPVYLKYEPRL